MKHHKIFIGVVLLSCDDVGEEDLIRPYIGMSSTSFLHFKMLQYQPAT